MTCGSVSNDHTDVPAPHCGITNYHCTLATLPITPLLPNTSYSTLTRSPRIRPPGVSSVSGVSFSSGCYALLGSKVGPCKHPVGVFCNKSEVWIGSNQRKISDDACRAREGCPEVIDIHQLFSMLIDAVLVCLLSSDEVGINIQANRSCRTQLPIFTTSRTGFKHKATKQTS
jgi:hypothetical protein